ncbi:MAG: hypothetical protein H7Y08_05670 [Rhizobiaceae bacterium]|nr:hypothetical protein [Rhizobiaceae bacterium]
MQPRTHAPRDTFDEKLDGILQRTQYHRVETDADRETIYRLRYDAYWREKTIWERADARFTDDYDKDENAFVFGVTIDGALAGSIRLHVVSPLCRRGPAVDTYGDILGPLLDGGETFVDPSRFVTNPLVRPGAKLLPFAVTRLACMAAEHFATDWMLATVRLEHAAFYRRFCSLKPLTAPRTYPCLMKPLMLLGERNEDIRESVFTRYPVFSSTLAERLALFEAADERSSSLEARPVNDNRSIRGEEIA